MDRREALQRTAMMLGYAISAPALMGVLNGCKAAPDLAYKPVFLSEDLARVVAEVAEIIIPKTDTPGAKDVGVPAFIDKMLNDCYTKEDQDRFIKGATDFDADAKATYGDSFVYCDAEKQKELVYKYHNDAIAATKSDSPPKERPFIMVVKELTMLGFFTSEPGATQVLRYEAVPGEYKGCIPFSEVGRTWAI
jgi:gluconate 2-dehydrogenase gamma chain